MISEDELRHMYWDKSMSMPEIAKEIGVSYTTVNRRMVKYGIELRTTSEARLIKTHMISKEKLYLMYREQNMSMVEIAEEVDVYPATVRNWMKEYGIESRTKSEALINGNFTGERSGGWRGGITDIKYCYKFNNEFKEFVRERDDYTCQLCGREQLLGGQKLDVHHIHYDKENCYPDVVTLCRSCNSSVNSDREYWEQYFEEQLITRGLLNWSISG